VWNDGVRSRARPHLGAAVRCDGREAAGAGRAVVAGAAASACWSSFGRARRQRLCLRSRGALEAIAARRLLDIKRSMARVHYAMKANPHRRDAAPSLHELGLGVRLRVAAASASACSSVTCPRIDLATRSSTRPTSRRARSTSGRCSDGHAPHHRQSAIALREWAAAVPRPRRCSCGSIPAAVAVITSTCAPAGVHSKFGVPLFELDELARLVGRGRRAHRRPARAHRQRQLRACDNWLEVAQDARRAHRALSACASPRSISAAGSACPRRRDSAPLDLAVAGRGAASTRSSANFPQLPASGWSRVAFWWRRAGVLLSRRSRS
jgi:hypothetical protein